MVAEARKALTMAFPLKNGEFVPSLLVLSTLSPQKKRKQKQPHVALPRRGSSLWTVASEGHADSNGGRSQQPPARDLTRKQDVRSQASGATTITARVLIFILFDFILLSHGVFGWKARREMWDVGVLSVD